MEDIKLYRVTSIWRSLKSDQEIGEIGDLPWDGVIGPKLVNRVGRDFVEYHKIEYVDYVEKMLQNKFTLSLTGKLDISKYESRFIYLLDLL